ncbi:ATP-binding cassette domain-containing protein [Colwellia sp. MB3u-70]|uniref:ATP-binding cassette domain-containing protein n=1 Tax=unclassified Colwellia TaxID=196834 RepID=UPI0015F4685F|nr:MULTISPECIES: ATP-binding cassette domain-containing protein [unclassified Colwellia]MBA6290993.1 ATP-binding cassette domain-containing protein [Colwellia sp. MB3u-8]MBA6308288.1 ATP-binding cassette domain-containing protein [Colwellia sp. MB3u-70]
MSSSFEINSLQIKNLTIMHQQTPLLALNETIKGGDVLTIMGPSGSGKSTLLNWLTGMLPKEFQADGQLYLNGANITKVASYQRNIGLLFQDALLFSHLSVAGNIAFAMPKGDRKTRAIKISQALSDVGLAGLENRQPESLSGGQQARVALLRVLLSQPKAILLDEPFSKLDSQLRQETRQLVFEQIRQHQLPVIMVTHDESDAIAANGKVLHLKTPPQDI